MYVHSLMLLSDAAEMDFLIHQRRTCYNGVYPYKIFPDRVWRKLNLPPSLFFMEETAREKQPC